MQYISKSFACLLLVLMPLQAIAASNMAVCNSMMQVTAVSEDIAADMPCHKQMDNVIDVTQVQKKSYSNTTCKSYCVAMSASLNVINITSSMIDLSDYLDSSSIISMPYQAYASITQASLLRPPIFHT